MKHIKQLDTIRAFAVILVIIHHWMPWDKVTNLHPGEIGVGMFFVLSGFLITRILLENKNRAEDHHASKTIVFKNFFVRRALRIFPIYYLLIISLYLIHETTDTGIKENFLYFLTYTSNFYFENRNDWDGIISHLWSLAVEEQFYLIWPPIILFIARKYLLHTILFFVLIGIVSQYNFSKGEFFGGLYMHNCFDAFGAGGCLAWIVVYKREFLPRFYRSISLLALVCLFLFFMGVFQHEWLVLPLRTVIAVISLYIITYIVYKEKKDNMLSWVLNNKALIFVGKISYGIYLYHLVIPHYTSDMLNEMLNQRLPIFLSKYSHYFLMIENFILLVIISWLSWIVFERPVLYLKKYFEYRQPAILISKAHQDSLVSCSDRHKTHKVEGSSV